jgi:hypothetical protein
MAEAVVHGHAGMYGHDLSPLLKELAVRMRVLTGMQKREAQGLLERPTMGQTAPGEDGYTVPEHNPPYCSLHYCIHWVDSGPDAPSLADTNNNGVPDYVEMADGVMEHVYQVENVDLAWRPPNPDGGLGGNDKTDVYIKDLGAQRIFGYSAPDPGQTGNSEHAYLVLDNDYSQSQYPRYSNPLPAMEVTAAHEYNHVLQFGYDTLEDTWMFEATAVWMEDKVYDDVNDYISYVNSWTQLSQVPITRFNSNDSTDPLNIKVYGDAVWNRFLDAHYGQDVIRGAWEQSLHANPPSFAPAAYDRSLALHGDGGFFNVFTDFVAHLPEWRAAADGFHDGSLWPDIQRVRTQLRADGPGLTGSLDHTAFALVNVEPATASRIKLVASLPAGTRGAIALVGRTGDPLTGTPTIALTRLPKGGAGTVVLNDPGAFERVTAVLVNADASESGFSNSTGDWVFKKDRQSVFARISTDFSALSLRKRTHTGSSIQVQFSKDVSDVTSHTVELLVGGRRVRAHIHYDKRTHRLTIVPSGGLRKGSRYTVQLAGDIADNGGNKLPPSERHWTFTARQ